MAGILFSNCKPCKRKKLQKKDYLKAKGVFLNVMEDKKNVC